MGKMFQNFSLTSSSTFLRQVPRLMKLRFTAIPRNDIVKITNQHLHLKQIRAWLPNGKHERPSHKFFWQMVPATGFTFAPSANVPYSIKNNSFFRKRKYL
jgi:hypothetical protein